MTDTNDAVEAWINYRPESDMVYAKEDAAIMRHAFMAGHQAALSHTNTSEGVEPVAVLANSDIIPSAIAAEPTETDPEYDCDDYGNSLWRCEIHSNDGLSTIAEVWGSNEIQAYARATAIAKTLRGTPPTPDTTHNAELVGELEQEADLCRNEGADDIAVLLDKAIAALRTPDSDLLREKLVDAFVLLPLEGDAGCDKLTEYEWEMVAEVAVQLLCSRLSPAQKGGA